MHLHASSCILMPWQGFNKQEANIKQFLAQTSLRWLSNRFHFLWLFGLSNFLLQMFDVILLSCGPPGSLRAKALRRSLSWWTRSVCPEDGWNRIKTFLRLAAILDCLAVQQNLMTWSLRISTVPFFLTPNFQVHFMLLEAKVRDEKVKLRVRPTVQREANLQQLH